MSGDNILVAVRVRPFNARETALNSKLIIQMEGGQTLITDPEAPAGTEPKTFSFDHCYWSHDEFSQTDAGYFKPQSSKYADQQRVFDDLGKGVLENAWNGYNCSLFAYGQTGSGKSYSIMGYANNKGIVPMTCDELFKSIDKAENRENFQVTFSMLEIYNEQVHDLLSIKNKGGVGMKVRQHPKKGFYVEDLKIVTVSSYKDIEARIEEGTRNRTIAATNMNATSSRAHTIVAINFSQKTKSAEGEDMTKTSVINLVDLAGSERADATGATGDRLKEGSAINQSLSNLGNVIAALVDVQSGKKNIQVPFRNSVLTKLLKNALGGNSRTIMIAALSPADVNYEETLSTLRFADRAKRIQNKAIVNESPTERLIRELKEENERLHAMLRGAQNTPIVVSPPSRDISTPDNAESDLIEDLKRQLESNASELEEMKNKFNKKQEEASNSSTVTAADVEKQERKKFPHLWNLNEDPALQGVICHMLKQSVTMVGNKKATPPVDIQLSGPNILDNLAVITNEKNKLFIKKLNASAKVLLNGKPLDGDDPVQLHHHHRVQFGSNHLYVVSIPAERDAGTKAGKKWKYPTFEEAQSEIAQHAGLSIDTSGQQSPEQILLQEELVSLVPHINEANAISEELDKKRFFEIVLVSAAARGLKSGKTEVKVKMRDLNTEHSWLWSRNYFLNRKFQMQEMYAQFIDGSLDWDRVNEKDPFWEPLDAETHVGSVHLYLQSLGYLLSMEETLTITDYKGVAQGHLNVIVSPCAQDGGAVDEDSIFIDSPEELLGQRADYMITIKSALGIPLQFTDGIKCRFKFYLDEEFTLTSPVSGTQNPEFHFKHQWTIPVVTQDFLDYIDGKPLIIEVWARQVALKQTSDLKTSDLFKRAATKIFAVDAFANPEEKSDEEWRDRMVYDLALERRMKQRLSSRLQRVEQLIKQYKPKGSTVPIAALEDAMHPKHHHRFRAVVRTIIIGNQWKRASIAKKRAEGSSSTINGTSHAHPLNPPSTSHGVSSSSNTTPQQGKFNPSMSMKSLFGGLPRENAPLGSSQMCSIQ